MGKLGSFSHRLRNHQSGLLLIVVAFIIIVLVSFRVSYILTVAEESRHIDTVDNWCADPTQAWTEIRKNPGNAEAHMGLTRYLSQRKEHAEAIKEAGMTLRLNPNEDEALLWLGHSLNATGQKNEGRKVLEKLARRESTWGKTIRKKLAKTSKP